MSGWRNTQYDARTRRSYVNVQTSGELLAIDPSKDVVVARYPIAGCKSNHGLVIDDAHRRAYIACEDNATLVVFDLTALKARQSLAIGDTPAVLAYDRGSSTLYIASESGVMSFLVANGGGLIMRAEPFRAKNAQIVAVHQRTHISYCPVLEQSDPKMLVLQPQ